MRQEAYPDGYYELETNRPRSAGRRNFNGTYSGRPNHDSPYFPPQQSSRAGHSNTRPNRVNTPVGHHPGVLPNTVSTPPQTYGGRGMHRQPVTRPSRFSHPVSPTMGHSPQGAQTIPTMPLTPPQNTTNQYPQYHQNHQIHPLQSSPTGGSPPFPTHPHQQRVFQNSVMQSSGSSGRSPPTKRDGDDFEHNISERVAVLNRVGKMLRRKVGHEREDKAYDSLMRTKTLHIVFFSFSGVISMIVGGCYTWYSGEFRTDTKWGQADPTTKTIMLCLQIITSLTTLVTICLIIQYYKLLLMNKRKEWAQVDDHADDDQAMADPAVRSSYSFWKSSWMKMSFAFEILAHVVHPVFIMQDFAYTLFTLCQIYMFIRTYLLIRVLHTFSRAYKLRIEIINSNRDFQTMNLRIKMGLTLKMLFYSKTTLVLIGAFVFVISIFSFMIFLVERDAQRNEFGRLENVFWFSFITFTTIGFGDFVPTTIPGRVITVILGIAGVVITTIFSGVLTNKLVPNKVQRYVVEYLQVRDALDGYRIAAGKLILAAYRAYKERKASHRRGTVPIGHKANRVYGAVKNFRRARYSVKGAVLPSTDPVLEEKMVALKQFLKDLDNKLNAQHEFMVEVQSKIDEEIAAILRELS